MTDQQPTVRDRVQKIVAEHLNVGGLPIQDSARFGEDLGADNLNTVELTMVTEEEFGIELPNEDLEKVDTFGDLVALVQRMLGAGSGGDDA